MANSFLTKQERISHDMWRIICFQFKIYIWWCAFTVLQQLFKDENCLNMLSWTIAITAKSMVSKDTLGIFFNKKFKHSKTSNINSLDVLFYFVFLSSIAICYFSCMLFYPCSLDYFWLDSNFTRVYWKCLYSLSNFVIYWATPHKNIHIWKICIVEIFKSNTNSSQFNAVYVKSFIYIAMKQYQF